MKFTFFKVAVTFIGCIFTFSCDRHDVFETVPNAVVEKEVIQSLDNLNSAIIQRSKEAFKLSLNKTAEKKYFVDQKVLVRNALNFTQEEIVILNELQASEISNYFDVISLPSYSQKQARIGLAMTSNYNAEQRILVEGFFNSLLLTMYEIEAIDLANNFDNQVRASSTLTDGQKYELYEVSSATRTVAYFLMSSGVDAIYDQLESDIRGNTSARIGRCKVEARGVWTDAIVGFFVGGAGGLKVGCAGGTVTLPGIGTATGCVGGAILGGAAGFVSGAITGVASQLLQTCFRNSV